MYKLLALLNGVLITIMIALNGGLSIQVGPYVSLVIIHLIGLLSIITIVLLTKTKFKSIKNIPIYFFTAGAIGVLNVFLNNLCFTTIGAALTIGLGVYGQLFGSVIIDHFGLFNMNKTPINRKKLIGFSIITIGIMIMILW